jgi:hypothetical protein
MQTPLWSSEPIGERRLRTADLFSSMLHWLGVPVPQGIDGRPTWQPGAPARQRRVLTSGRHHVLI